MRKQLVSGILYTGFAKYSGIIISVIVTAILARLLRPEDFGVIVIATILINFFSTISVSGFSPAIIQNKDINETDIKNIFGFTILLAFLLSVLFVLVIPLFVSFYDNDEQLKNICLLLTANIFFSLLSIVPNALLYKDKLFKFIAVRTITIQASIGVLAIAAAYMGAGVYALVINPIFSSLLLFVVSIRKRPVKPVVFFRWESIRKIFIFSVYQILFNITYVIYRSIDKIMIGKEFGKAALGYYEKSHRLMMLPLENVAHVINPVLHPVLSEYQHDTKFVMSSYVRIVRMLMEAGFLLGVIMLVSAKELILIFFGDQWHPSIPVFEILALSVGIQIAQSPVGAVFQSLNKVRELFISSVLVLVAVVFAVWGGIYAGSVEKMALFLVMAFYAAYFIYNIVLFRLTRTSVMPIVKALLISVAISVVLAGIYYALSYCCPVDNMFLSLSVKVIIFVIYTILLLRFKIITDWPVPDRMKKWIGIKYHIN